jgi:2-polyprenyl-6-methoxyphenol hydroxylase-like FAD-dependent oxidoreductase
VGSSGEHAVVIGASMAGLAIAKALTAGFERVTVLDRDRVTDEYAHRSGVPQGRHVHLLLAAGADALESLFPGLLEELVADGAPAWDFDRARLCVNGHRLARGRIGRDSITASRPFVEAHVRKRVRVHPAITIRDESEVRGLELSPDGRRVVGVRVGSRGGGGTEQTVSGDLVVDSSGRRSRMPEWLQHLGYAPPGVDELNVEVRYATRRYRLPSEALDGDVHALAGPTRDGPRGGSMIQIEGACGW